MKLKVTIGIFIAVFLGLFFLLYANRRSSNDYAYAQIASLEGNYISNEEQIVENEYIELEPLSEPIVPDAIFEICKPSPLSNVSEQIIQRNTYIVSYNQETKIPNWVAWHLMSEHTDGPWPRLKNFYEDEEAPLPRATLDDYRHSGWTRGHMCPAGDNKWDSLAMYETFALTNICPQNEKLNNGLWNSIENDCRKWARKYGDIFIVCGPVFLQRVHETIGENRVFVPEAFFKVVLCLNGTPKGFGFIVRNTEGNRKKDLYYNSIDDIERITGIDFFPALPDSIEDEVESQCNINDW